MHQEIVTPLSHWITFSILIVVALCFELRRTRQEHTNLRQASVVSLCWIALAFLFNGWIFYAYGKATGLDFLAGYLVEKSLSVDNLFVFFIIFSRFELPHDGKHRVLFYGVLGAIFMRGLLIWAGISFVQYFEWSFYLLGLFLIFSAFQLAKKSPKEETAEDLPLFNWVKEHLPMTSKQECDSFFIKENGKLLATPLLLVLILIELSDLIFALDSVPAILGITIQPFIVFTSNVFAILGLRSLFFVLEGLINNFELLHYALVAILFFIGMKMLLGNYIHISTPITLSVIFGSLATAGLVTLYRREKNKRA